MLPRNAVDFDDSRISLSACVIKLALRHFLLDGIRGDDVNDGLILSGIVTTKNPIVRVPPTGKFFMPPLS